MKGKGIHSFFCESVGAGIGGLCVHLDLSKKQRLLDRLIQPRKESSHKEDLPPRFSLL